MRADVFPEPVRPLALSLSKGERVIPLSGTSLELVEGWADVSPEPVEGPLALSLSKGRSP